MSVFLLTNNLTHINHFKNDSVTIERGFKFELETQLGEYFLRIYRHVDDLRPYRISNAGEEIFFFGSVFYKKKFGAEAVKLFHDDLLNSTVDSSMLMGSFCILYLDENKNCNIVNDSGAIYQLYSNEQGDFITNSFLISSSIVQNKTINEMAFNANLLIGYIPYPDTLFSVIKRIQCEDKWGKFLLKQFDNIDNGKELKNYKDHVDYQTQLINAYINNLSDALITHGVEMGISGGYDSRLILGMLLDKGIKISAHTHYKKNDADPIIAQQLCDLVGIPLKLISERPALKRQEDFDAILNGSFLQFDGRVNSMMDFGKFEYTRDYRAKLFKASNIMVSGVGGEMYRNHNFFNRNKISVDQFIVYYLINHRNWSIIHPKKKFDFLDYLKVGVEHSLDNKNYVSYKDNKRYYKSNWLRDWHGTRNTAENHFSAYVSPFADSFLSNAALRSVAHHGLLGKFEIDLIRSQNPKLTKLNSSYGFAFDDLPFFGGQKELMKILAPIWIKMFLASKIKNIKTSNSITNRKFQEKKYIDIVKDSPLNFDLYQFIKNSGNIELTYSLGYILNKST